MLIARAQGRIQSGIRGDHGHRAVKEPGRSIHFALFHADQIELGLARIDQNFARRVLEIKLASTGARGVMMPRAAAASRVALPFLDLDFVEVAWGARNGTGHGGPADGLAADRHQSHRDASDGHFGRVFDHPILAVNAKPFEERVEAKAEPEDQRKVDSSDSSTHPSPESRSKCVRPLARPSLAFSAGEWATLRGWNWTALSVHPSGTAESSAPSTGQCGADANPWLHGFRSFKLTLQVQDTRVSPGCSALGRRPWEAHSPASA